ncbi:MAG: hypothetical protein R2777_00290 [Chitinophagales bacterium]
MNILRNILAVVVGLVVGSYVNMFIIKFGSPYFPLPEGVNPNDMESIKANIHLYSFKHFITPWLAHAVGVLVGAILTAIIAATYKARLALIIGAFFLLGGIAMVYMLPQTPIWFILADLVLAYIPMAWLGGTLGMMINKK